MSLPRYPGTELRGRASECSVLDAHVVAGRSGSSRTVVLRGEAGIGKTALLDYVAAAERRLSDPPRGRCRIGDGAAVRSRIISCLQPLLDGLDRLPPPQRVALETAFGLSSGAPPDRFFVGLALLSQLSDPRKSDRSSVSSMTSSGLIDPRPRFCPSSRGAFTRSLSSWFSPSGTGMPRASSRDCPSCGSTACRRATHPRWSRLSHSVLWTSRCAIASLPRRAGTHSPCLSSRENDPPQPWRVASPCRAGCPCPAESRTATGDDGVAPKATQHLLLLAAADPVGDPNLLWRAAAELGIPAAAAAPAEAEHLLQINGRVGFRHPLLRSAIYQAASPEERRNVHRALAAATDPAIDPDRRAWHHAQAVLGPSDIVAAELERSAGRAQARGGLAAAAAFLQRSVALTQEPHAVQTARWRPPKRASKRAHSTRHSRWWP